MSQMTNPVSFLLVDDLEENLFALEALLRRDDLRILKARSGDEALELLLKNDIALALIDVQMPGLDGFELAELMRGNERTRRIPIIFVTAENLDAQRRFRGYEAGAVDFVYKPIEAEVLRSKAGVFFELFRQRQQIASQRDALQSQAEALTEADVRKDEFLATLAHELRNPLAPLRHGLDILRKRPDGPDSAEIREMMDRQLVHLVRLIDDLLDVSRVTQGKIELRKTRVELSEIVRSAIEVSRPWVDSAAHALIVDLPPEPLWIEGDLTRLAQIVGNLLNNAAKYTPEGGRIELAVRGTEETAEISVSDNGVGIAADMQSKVFQLFTQVDNHLDRSRGGLGIGLALVKRLVDMHEGTIDLESAGEGKGTTFRVRIPRAAPPAPASRPEESEHQSSTSKPLRILVVDDTIEVAQTIGWMLEEIGHDYHLVHDGRLALQAATEYEPDAILLDIGLPGMDGYEVCRAFRRDEKFKSTPIIAQTGWGQDRDKASASAAGFDHHLVKPVRFDELEKVLQDTVRAAGRAI
jgi:signal transduction histidine kinase